VAERQRLDIRKNAVQMIMKRKLKFGEECGVQRKGETGEDVM